MSVRLSRLKLGPWPILRPPPSTFPRIRHGLGQGQRRWTGRVEPLVQPHDDGHDEGQGARKREVGSPGHSLTVLDFFVTFWAWTSLVLTEKCRLFCWPVHSGSGKLVRLVGSCQQLFYWVCRSSQSRGLDTLAAHAWSVFSRAFLRAHCDQISSSKCLAKAFWLCGRQVSRGTFRLLAFHAEFSGSLRFACLKWGRFCMLRLEVLDLGSPALAAPGPTGANMPR